MTGSVEAINTFYPVEEATKPQLTLAAEDGVTVDILAIPEDELANRRADKFKGRVAIEGLEAKYDGITQLAELVDGNMRTEFELTFDGNDLYGPDGRSLTETGVKALEAAREETKTNPELWFEVDRRSIELDEIYEIIDMVKGNSANTMVLTSDFPEPLRRAKQDVGGYNVTRQQAMGRAVTLNRDTGKIKLLSQTLDGSNRSALDAVHNDLGFQTVPGALVSQRRYMTLSSDKQATIMDRVTTAYDKSMTAQFTGEWYAGRRPADIRNTYDFVCSQHDLVDSWVELEQNGKLTDSIKYDMAATMQARFKTDKQQAEDSIPKLRLVSTNPVQLQQEIAVAGRQARVLGMSFSSCGGTLRAEGLDQSTESLLGEAGFGDKDEKEELSWHGGKTKYGQCVSCKEKTQVGVADWCKKCISGHCGTKKS